MAGVVAAARPAPSAEQPAAWTPLNMTVVPQIYLDAQDSVVTDVSGVASAVSNLGAMGANGDFTTAATNERPQIISAELNGKSILRFDGVNDRLVGTTPAQKGLFRNTLYAWAFIVYKKRTSTTGLTSVLFQSTIGPSAGVRFGAWAGYTGDDNKPIVGGRRLDGDAAGTNIVAPSARVGDYAMALFRLRYNTRMAYVHIDGSVAASGLCTATTGFTSDTDASYQLAIGNFPSATTGAANIDLASIVTDRSDIPDNDIDRLFGWAAHKYGLTANLPADHPYKTAAPTV